MSDDKEFETEDAALFGEMKEPVDILDALVDDTDPLVEEPEVLVGIVTDDGTPEEEVDEDAEFQKYMFQNNDYEQY